MYAHEIVTSDVVTVESTDTIQDAIDVLNELDIRHLPVVENEVLKGMISDRDLREFALPEMIRFSNPEKAAKRCGRPVSDLMYTDLLTVGPEDDITDVIEIMINHKIGAVPVCDQIEGRLVGIISYVDVLQSSLALF